MHGGQATPSVERFPSLAALGQIRSDGFPADPAGAFTLETPWWSRIRLKVTAAPVRGLG